MQTAQKPKEEAIVVLLVVVVGMMVQSAAHIGTSASSAKTAGPPLCHPHPARVRQRPGSAWPLVANCFQEINVRPQTSNPKRGLTQQRSEPSRGLTQTRSDPSRGLTQTRSDPSRAKVFLSIQPFLQSESGVGRLEAAASGHCRAGEAGCKLSSNIDSAAEARRAGEGKEESTRLIC
ncbi:unnamed protein product [Boreogadus saida]